MFLWITFVDPAATNEPQEDHSVEETTSFISQSDLEELKARFRKVEEELQTLKRKPQAEQASLVTITRSAGIS